MAAVKKWFPAERSDRILPLRKVMFVFGKFIFPFGNKEKEIRESVRYVVLHIGKRIPFSALIYLTG